jgi:hypothetical protein
MLFIIVNKPPMTATTDLTRRDLADVTDTTNHQPLMPGIPIPTSLVTTVPPLILLSTLLVSMTMKGATAMTMFPRSNPSSIMAMLLVPSIVTMMTMKEPTRSNPATAMRMLPRSNPSSITAMLLVPSVALLGLLMLFLALPAVTTRTAMLLLLMPSVAMTMAMLKEPTRSDPATP